MDLPPTLRKIETAPNKEVDAVLATSVFGTGIDIRRLGLMAVMGQPKTTSSYIQSTGRIGRQIGGLVVTYLRAARVRDLNHYENFVGYHRMIQNFVEPISASPYSEQTLQTCLGAISVAILRNARDIEKTMVSQEWSKGDQPIRMRFEFMNLNLHLIISYQIPPIGRFIHLMFPSFERMTERCWSNLGY